MRPATQIVARWSRRQARCNRCGQRYETGACPTCGDRPGAEPVAMIAVLTETPTGIRLWVVEDLDGQRITRATRTLTGEQLHWLRDRPGQPTAGLLAPTPGAGR
ncbi:MAG: hypothetical protein ACRD2C_04225 [Acidimicrobiales bacterium]